MLLGKENWARIGERKMSKDVKEVIALVVILLALEFLPEAAAALAAL
jgi:hypothetical protein